MEKLSIKLKIVMNYLGSLKSQIYTLKKLSITLQDINYKKTTLLKNLVKDIKCFEHISLDNYFDLTSISILKEIHILSKSAREFSKGQNNAFIQIY